MLREIEFHMYAVAWHNQNTQSPKVVLTSGVSHICTHFVRKNRRIFNSCGYIEKASQGKEGEKGIPAIRVCLVLVFAYLSPAYLFSPTCRQSLLSAIVVSCIQHRRRPQPRKLFIQGGVQGPPSPPKGLFFIPSATLLPIL